MAENRRITELRTKTTGFGDGSVIVANQQSGRDEQGTVQEALKATRASFPWNTGTSYSIGNLVLFTTTTSERVWSSLVNSNVGNVPTEGVNWTEKLISIADGITLTPWAAGVFTYNNSYIDINGAFYTLNVPAPFESTDFNAEFAATQWQFRGGIGAVDYLQFLTNSSPLDAAGVISFDGVNFNGRDNISGTLLQFGKEVAIDAYNNNGVNFENFDVVNFDTAVGGEAGAKKALADTIDNADGAIVVTHQIIPTAVGKATFVGSASGDTSAWEEDDFLFLSSTVAGLMTNVEQEILVILARVLVKNADPDIGKILLTPSRLANITAIGQAAGLNEVQSITAVPAVMYAFDADKFELNVDVTQVQNPEVGEDGYDADLSPASIGATGYYRITISVSLTGSGNGQHIIELYLNGSPTGFVGIIDLTNNNIDAGSATIAGTFSSKLSNTDSVKPYIYTDGGASAVVYESALSEIDRSGNV